MTDRERTLEKLKYQLIGVVLDAMCADREHRARIITQLPATITRLLETLYDDAQRDKPKNNGVADSLKAR